MMKMLTKTFSTVSLLFAFLLHLSNGFSVIRPLSTSPFRHYETMIRPVTPTTTTTTTTSSPSSTPLMIITSKKTTSVLYAVKKKKISMAEKRKRRQAKQQRSESIPENMPRANLDFGSPTTTMNNNKNSDDDNDSPLRIDDPVEAANQAKELLKAQRESVDMLTMVRERVEALPVDDILNALLKDGDDDDEEEGGGRGDGYIVVDNFLNNDNILDQLYKESTVMYQENQMETDTSNLGSGEYIVSIKGGKEQYKFCPRLVELVVSTTKHIPEVVKKGMNLDASACMATLRTFDRTVLKASLALLTGEKDNVDTVVEQTTRQFKKVVTNNNNSNNDDGGVTDKRRLTLHYYILPDDSWDESLGGGLEFNKATTTATTATSNEAAFVAPKRDRLVLWKSDTTMYRTQPWKGSDEKNLLLGSSLELHLVQGAPKE